MSIGLGGLELWHPKISVSPWEWLVALTTVWAQPCYTVKEYELLHADSAAFCMTVVHSDSCAQRSEQFLQMLSLLFFSLVFVWYVC